MIVADLISVYIDLYEGGKNVLHIVNGDSVAEKLRQGVVQEDILVWREVYPHGPVFLDASDQSHRSVRAEYLEQTMGIPHLEFIEGSETQERALADFHKYEEIVLWFEHDLFDQTILCYLLHWFSEQSTLGNTKLSLLSIGEYPGIDLFRGMGQLSVEQMKTLPGTWKSIGAEELALGRAWWLAYTSQTPQLLQQLLATDTTILPYAHDAFQCHLARFPSTYNGLGVAEQTTLEMVRAGVKSPYELFKHVGNKLNALGMGDLQYWHILRGMSREPFPLLLIEGIQTLPDYLNSRTSLHNTDVILTDLGIRILNGEVDWVLRKGIDEWYGGVHVEGYSPRWRWNTSLQMIQDMRNKDNEGMIEEDGEGALE